ncbi:MAG TPA: TIGR00282 family metallophosphoesterase [Patescibacteria group bacterium]
MIKIFFFGDVVAKIGRRAVKKIIPEIRKKYRPDLIMANAENIAHGIGTTPKTLNELTEAGVDFFTNGNHIWKKEPVKEILETADSVMIRPANYPANRPGRGEKIIEISQKKLLVINLLGRVFMEDQSVNNPFKTADQILEKYADENLAGIIIDFHAEATSEKNAFGRYLDGKVSAILGTHTHIQSADEKILPGGAAYITDVGMTGAENSIIGVKTETVINNFVNEVQDYFDYDETGPAVVNGVYLEIDSKTKKAVTIKRFQKKIII